MKTILLIFALLFAHQSIAVAPYGFKGQDQTATQYSNVLKFKNRSVVKTGGINSLVEDQDNLLYNGGFEATPDLDGWTCVGAGSSFTIESKPVSASVVISGDKTLAIGCATVGGCTCTQDFSVNQQQAGRSVLLSGIVRSSSDTQGLKLTYRENGADTSITTENVLNGIPATEAVIGSSATTIGIKLTVPYSATPLVVRADEIKMAYGTAVTNHPAIGPRIKYSPTFQGFGTPSNVDCEYNQDGPNLILDCLFTSQSDSASPRIGLPSGLTIGGTWTGNKVAGTFAVGSVGLNKGGFALMAVGNSYITLTTRDVIGSASVGSLSTATAGSDTCTAGVVCSIKAVVPIAQYASSVPTYTGRCTALKDCETVFTADISSGGVVSNETFDWINGNCTSMTGGTCTFNTGYFTVPPVCALAGIRVANYVSVGIDSVSSTGMVISAWKTSTETAVAQGARVICVKSGVDYFNSKTLQQNVALKSYVQTPSTTGKVGFCSAKISATGVISDHLGGCFASCTNATTPVCTFTSNYWRSESVPNCWVSVGPSVLGNPHMTTTTTTTFSGAIVQPGTNTAISGAREYFCHGEIQ